MTGIEREYNEKVSSVTKSILLDYMEKTPKECRDAGDVRDAFVDALDEYRDSPTFYTDMMVVVENLDYYGIVKWGCYLDRITHRTVLLW